MAKSMRRIRSDKDELLKEKDELLKEKDEDGYSLSQGDTVGICSQAIPQTTLATP